MQTRLCVRAPVILAIALVLRASPLAGEQVDAPPGQGTVQFYTPSLTPAIYLINFLFLYIANPDIAAYLPAFKAPIPQAVIDCLEKNPAGCPYAPLKHYFDEQEALRGENRNCFWTDACQEEAKWEALAPRKFRQPEHINEPIGRKRADQLAHLLGITDDMILTAQEYRCLIGTPPRTQDQETFFRCIYNMTNSKGNAVIPLSSYGLNVNEDGDIRSVCATGSPCLIINSLLTGYLEKTAIECGFLEKLVRLGTQTPFRQLIADANKCQESGGAACLIETDCPGK